MDKKNIKSHNDNLSTFIGLIKNVKFIIITIISLIFFGAAIISGDINSMFLSLYENVTGQKYKTYTPIQDDSSATYIILKDKLSRDFNSEKENAEIFIFKESDNLHSYRVKINNDVYFYSIKKNHNNIWQINKEP